MRMSLIICGSGSLPREDDNDNDDELNHERATQSAGSSPRKSCSSSSRKTKNHNQHHHNNKNPYSDRGLDKFSSLLAKIEEKKQIIYSENNPDEICFVQFDYSKNNNCKPIVIKVKPNKGDKAEIGQAPKKIHQQHDPDHITQSPSSASTDQNDNNKPVDRAPIGRKKSLLRRLKVHDLRKPSCYLPAMVILILIFLVLFGRSVAILCTSIVWYAIPTISRRSLNSRSLKKKKGSLVVGHQERGL